MKRLSTIRAAAFAAISIIPLVLTACDSSSSEGVVDPGVAQQLIAARANPDLALAEKVRKALGTGEGAAYGVDATAADGKVTLWGTVESTAERKRLVTTAAGVVGVRALQDNLKLDSGA